MKITLVILFLIFSTNACQTRSGEETMNPDMAKSMIKLKGYNADEVGLFQAIRSNDIVILKAFFDAGINPNAINEAGETTLTFAIQYADNKTVKVLLDKVNINLQDKKGDSPIHLALLKNKDAILEALLAKGADVNVAGRDKITEGQSVLYLAVIRSREDLIQKLLEKGADPNQADTSGAVPLSEACIGALAKPSIVKMLIEKGANPNLRENKGGSPLLFIAANTEISSPDRQEIVKMLLAKGADKKIKDNSGRTSLGWAKRVGNKDIFDILK